MSANATCTPRFALISCASWRRPVAEASLGIVGARGGRIFSGIGGFQHFHRVECFLAGAVQHAVGGVVVHCLERVAAGELFGFLPPTEKSLMLFIATVGSEPLKIRGTDGPSAIARKGDAVRRSLAGP